MKEFDNVKIFTDDIDWKALEQIYELNDTGIFEDSPIRIMPDVHAGAGCVIGFTARIKNRIIPNLVGVDIGCGMYCVPLGNLDINYHELDLYIKEHIPSGRNVNDHFDTRAISYINTLRCGKSLKNVEHLICSLGTLGGGNHFIEVDSDEEGNKYLVIHSGSRNLGKQVAEYYQDLAIKRCRSNDIQYVIADLKAQGRFSEIESVIQKMKLEKKRIPNSLCWLEGQDMDDYLHDMDICVQFAYDNRCRIAESIVDGLYKGKVSHFWPKDAFTTIHNYIDLYGKDGSYIRKGAIDASEGKQVLIPLNMRDGCIIGIGKGNVDWNYSAPHGAGRVMSRAEAKKQLTVDNFLMSMQGIYTSTANESTIDEAPFAYKPAQEIVDLVKDTVDIVKIIKPVYNYKAAE